MFVVNLSLPVTPNFFVHSHFFGRNFGVTGRSESKGRIPYIRDTSPLLEIQPTLSLILEKIYTFTYLFTTFNVL